MPVALRTNFMPLPLSASALPYQFKPSQRGLGTSELWQELLGFPGIEDVYQKDKLYRRIGSDTGLTPRLVVAAGILPPRKWLRPVGAAHNINESIAVNVDR